MSIIVAAGYKQTKVGIIPEDWDVVKLGDIGKFIGGGTPSTQNIGFWSGDIPWISSSDLIEDNIRHINITRFITKEAINNSATKMVPINSILIVTRVGVGKVAVNQQVLCTSQDFQNIILENNNSYFFAYLLQQKTRKLIELNQGTTIKGLVKEDLSSLLMESPPLAEQEKIAEILTTWDNAIIKHEQLIEQKQIFKKGLMQQIFSQQLRFKDDNDNYYPDWQKTKLKNIALIYQPRTITQTEFSESGYPVFGANGIIGYYREYNHELEQIAITCRGNTCGTVNFTNKKSWITGNAMVINVDNNLSVDKKFLYQILKNTNLTYLITGTGQPQITSKIGEHFLNLPTLEEQTKIANLLTSIDDEIERLKQILAGLKLQKQSLMQKLLTGQVRVTNLI